jgi:hypothetical protein
MFTLKRGFKGDNLDGWDAEEVVTCPYETKLDMVGTNVAAHSATTQRTISIDVSALRGLIISSDQDVTLETNASPPSTAGNTINLKAGVPYIWSYAAGYNTCLLTHDVTSVYVTVAGTTDANVRIRAGMTGVL